MATPKKIFPKVQFQIDHPAIPQGPNSGFLYLIKPHPRDNYVANSCRAVFNTGVIAAVPAGVTVLIEGLYDNELRGYNVVPQRIVGPTDPQKIFVAVWNHSHETIAVAVDEPIATIRALQTEAPLIWQERDTNAEEEEARQDLLGGRAQSDAG
jgi:hypothetical protein